MPTYVSNPFSIFEMKSQALAFFNASIISSSVASVFPYNKFSLILVANNTGSYPTNPILPLKSIKSKSLTFNPYSPPNKTSPLSQS